MRNHPTDYKKELGIAYRGISRIREFFKREAEGHDRLSILAQRSQTRVCPASEVSKYGGREA